MPDELELLRELGRDAGEPDPRSVERARAVLRRRIEAKPGGRGRVPIARSAAALLLALGVGAGFGLAAWLSPSGSATSSFLGFGFLPAKGWTVVQSGTVGATGTAHAVAANVPLELDAASADPPYAALRGLPPSGAVIVARLFPRGNESRDRFFPLRTLPLQIGQAEPIELSRELAGTSLVALRVRGAVAGYDVDAQVFFGGPPSPAALAAVDEQLRRLVVAPGGVTLVVLPTIIPNTSQRMTIFGSISSGKANEQVTIQFKACGLLPVRFRDAFETTTRAGGGYSLAELRPFNLGVSGVFRAVSGDQVSAEVRVQQRASVGLRPLTGGRFSASAYGKNASFWHRYVLIQRFARATGVWTTMRRLVLTETVNANWVRTRPFRPVVPKGTSIRAVFPLSQARPCYLAGYSPIRTT